MSLPLKDEVGQHETSLDTIIRRKLLFINDVTIPSEFKASHAASVKRMQSVPTLFPRGGFWRILLQGDRRSGLPSMVKVRS